MLYTLIFIRKSPRNRAKVNLNNSYTAMAKVIKAGGKEVAERKRQCYTKKSKGMLLCLLLLYFIVSLSMQRLFS